jgi:hypothetical protein
MMRADQSFISRGVDAVHRRNLHVHRAEVAVSALGRLRQHLLAAERWWSEWRGQMQIIENGRRVGWGAAGSASKHAEGQNSDAGERGDDDCGTGDLGGE